MPAYANVNGETVIDGALFVPNVGPWWAEVTFETAPDLSGAVTFSLGPLDLSGTIDPTHDGVFGEQRRSRIIGGGGGWGTLVPAQHYHNDAGVRALAVAQDAARLAGETLGDFNPAADAVGVDYVRESGAASRVLEDVIGGVPWFVDYSGSTIVGERTQSEAATGSYEVLDFNPRENLATVAIDDLSLVGVGSILTEGLDGPLTVFGLEVRVGVDSSRTVAWGGGTAAGRGRLAGALRRIVESVTDDRLFGKYRYRVVSMSGDRVELQAVVARPGLPDILPVSQKPGCAGAHASLAGGSVVLVEFVEGDRTLPLVVAYAGKGEEGHAPTELDLSVATTLRLGSDGASEGVTLGDSHKSWVDAHTHSYTPAVHTGPANTAQTSPPTTGPLPAGIPDPAPATSSRVFAE